MEWTNTCNSTPIGTAEVSGATAVLLLASKRRRNKRASARQGPRWPRSVGQVAQDSPRRDRLSQVDRLGFEGVICPTKIWVRSFFQGPKMVAVLLVSLQRQKHGDSAKKTHRTNADHTHPWTCYIRLRGTKLFSHAFSGESWSSSEAHLRTEYQLQPNPGFTTPC